MKKIILSVILIYLFPIEVISQVKDSVRVKIQASSRIISAKEKLFITFEVHNEMESDMFFCPWQTPLEDMSSDAFLVLLNAQRIAYTGLQIKRPEPTPKDYVKVGPKKHLSVTIDLKEFYEIDIPGNYSIQFIGSDINKLQNSNIIECTIY